VCGQQQQRHGFLGAHRASGQVCPHRRLIAYESGPWEPEPLPASSPRLAGCYLKVPLAQPDDLLIERTHDGLAAARARGRSGGRAALYGTLAQIEALGLKLLEVRRLPPD
jgi:hypothetical protein